MDQRIVNTNEGSQLVNIQPSFQSEYGKIDRVTLTNFYQSLEDTLDKNQSCHLFPNYHPNKNFFQLFPYEQAYFGPLTNSTKISQSDYQILAQIFAKFQQEKPRKVLVIGRTGNGKTTVVNVLLDPIKQTFQESSASTSETREVQIGLLEINLDVQGKEKASYQIIDTVGIGDTQITPQGVL